METLLELLPKAKEELKLKMGDPYRLSVGIQDADGILAFVRANPYENVIVEVSRFIEPGRFLLRSEP